MIDSDKGIIHARSCGQGEHSLCGMAFDAFETGNADAQIVFAGDGEMVTCTDCQSYIRYIRSSFRRFTFQPKDQPQ